VPGAGPGSAALAGTLRATLVAQTAVRRRVTAVAAGLPPPPPPPHTAHALAHAPHLLSGGGGGGGSGSSGGGWAGVVDSHHRLEEAGEGDDSSAAEGSESVPAAIADEREGVCLSALRTSDPSSAAPMEYPHFMPVAADPTARSVLAVAKRRPGEVAGIDSAGRVFVL